MYTQMYQRSCFMGQWFKFVKQLLQMLLKALSCDVCIDIRYSAIRNQFGCLPLGYYESLGIISS
jgi:hypothetical protein